MPGWPKVGKAFRTTMVWQSAASVVLAVVAATRAGDGGFVSAALGGGIGVLGVLVFALLSQRRAITPGDVVRIALRAEAAKIVAVVLLLWLVFATYQGLVLPAFFGAFIVSVLLSGIAFAVSNE